MASRILPGAYVTLNDLSYFPEGMNSLTVGYVLQCDRGDTDKPMLVTSPSDFLAKTTLNGYPEVNADPTFWSILKVLARTNQLYIARAANHPLYGGVLIKKTINTIGTIKTAVKATKTFTMTAEAAPAVGTVINVVDVEIGGYYTVETAELAEGTVTMTVKENIPANYEAGSGDGIEVKSTPIVPLAESIEDPEAWAGTNLTEDDILLITGINPGKYNGELAFSIISSVDKPEDLPYENTMQLTVYNVNTGAVLETFTFSRDEAVKTIDGTSLFVDSVVQGSAYIKVINNTSVAADVLPVSTEAPVQAGGGSAGGEVTANTLVGALELFADKTIPVSIIGNGCSTQAETALFQQGLLEIADTRKDLMVFLNSRKLDEQATLNSEKAQNIVDYKKGKTEDGLGSTSFYGCMYAPHLNASDTFNDRTIKIGADGVAIAGWLNVINNLNYPYAYAGPQNGLVTGVTCDWKIGDMSGEAELLNDASVNYVAFDGKVGRYYMQCQNTLQIANSSLRNIGCVLNVLDIKETLGTTLKEYCNLPITDILRRDILNSINDYLSPMVGTRFYNYSFQDVTTEADIAQDTLRYLLTISLTRYATKIYCAINVVGPNYDFSLLQSV